MKRMVFISLILLVSIAFGSCSGMFGYEKYTDINDYPKVFELPEIRCMEALELFPETVDSLDVKEFYFEWKLGIIGSADVQFILSVEYNDTDLDEEISRIQSLANGKAKYDTESFEYNAYVLVLGYHNTSYYALVDGNTIHYVLLQLLNKSDIDFNSDFLPKGYSDFGDVIGVSYNAYE